jgi:Na+/proline symporter
MQADLYAGALVVVEATKMEGESSIYLAIFFVLCIAVIYTIAGGLSAVIWTDLAQAVLMVGGSIVLIVVGAAMMF